MSPTYIVFVCRKTIYVGDRSLITSSFFVAPYIPAFNVTFLNQTFQPIRSTGSSKKHDVAMKNADAVPLEKPNSQTDRPSTEKSGTSNSSNSKLVKYLNQHNQRTCRVFEITSLKLIIIVYSWQLKSYDPLCFYDPWYIKVMALFRIFNVAKKCSC